MAPRFWATTPTRFVALASMAGSPRKIRIGRVRNEPPPAMVFRTEAAKPATASRRWFSVAILAGCASRF
jgi:hypothetical protein